MDVLVEERLAQLQEVSKRRNELLVSMFRHIKQRENLAAVAGHLEEEDEEELEQFLQRFNVQDDLEGGSIANLQDEELIIPELPHFNTQPPSEEPKRIESPRARSRENMDVKPPSPSPSIEEPQPDLPDEPIEEDFAPETTQPRSPARPQRSSSLSAMDLASDEPAPFDTVTATPAPTSVYFPAPEAPKPTYTIPLPISPIHEEPAFQFGAEPMEDIAASPFRSTIAPTDTLLQAELPYTIPPLKSLPPEFGRKMKSTKSRKRDKDRASSSDCKKDKDEWTPLGLQRMVASIKANPTWKRVSKAAKCLNTREWSIAMSELTLIRTLDRIETLKDGGRWGFRQPKKHKPIGIQAKTHWDHLMDEMKWMRVDFREERKWKTALAYALVHEARAWHEAGSLEERVKRGICVPWHPPRCEQPIEPGVEDMQMLVDGPTQSNEETPVAAADDGWEGEDSDEEQDREQQEVFNVLDGASDLQAALDSTSQLEHIAEPKQEEVDHSSALLDSAMPITEDTQLEEAEPMDTSLSVPKAEDGETSGLKSASSDPILPNYIPDSSSGAKHNRKSSTYAAFKEKIAALDELTLFLDWDALNYSDSDPSLAPDGSRPDLIQTPSDLSTIFPDLALLTISDGLPAESKRAKSGKPDAKRVDETLYTKLVPVGQFMNVKPTLVGALEPAKHWKNGEWHLMDDTALNVDYDGPIIKPSEENGSALFDPGKPSFAPAGNAASVPAPPSDTTKRAAENPWTQTEDELLKGLADKYPNNWSLISETFNSNRFVATERRTPWDCLYRWNTLRTAGRSPSVVEEAKPEPPPTPSTPASAMTTRGVKRQAAANLANSSGNGDGIESRKRRRHTTMHDAILKATKKRVQQQKTQAGRKSSSVVHDTHAQFNKLPRYNPIELSRMKQDKEQEAIRQELARRVQYRANGMQNAQAMQQMHAMQQAQQQAQQQAGAAGAAGAIPRTGIPNVARLAQARAQVNISGQQRTGTPLANAASRMSPQQILQAQQAAQARAMAAAQATNNHLSPQFASRAATSSPAAGVQGSPAVAAANIATSPRPAPANQPFTALPPAGQIPPNGAARPVSNMAYHLPGPQHNYTPEQVMIMRQQQQLQLQSMQNMGNPPTG